MKKIMFNFGMLLVATGGIFFWLNTPYRYLLESNAELNSNKVAKAILVLQEGEKKYPENNKITFALARAYLMLGEIEQANKTIQGSKSISQLKKEKSFQDFLLDLAEANHQQGDKKLAKKLALQYLEYHDSEENSQRIIKNYIRLGQVLQSESVEHWERAFNIAHAIKKPDLKESIKTLLLPKYFELVDELRANKKYDEALEVLQKAKIVGNNAEVNYREGIIYGELEKIDLACKQFEEALELDPENDSYKITYANVLKKAAFNTKDKNKRLEYSEKIKLLLASITDDVRKTNLLNKIISLNAKFKVTNGNLKITMVDEYFYPSLVFKIKPVSDTKLNKYKIVFVDQKKKQLDEYEAPVTDNEINQLLEVTCRNPIDNENGNLIKAKLFLNGEFVREYSNK